jgi:hypothetical protein
VRRRQEATLQYNSTTTVLLQHTTTALQCYYSTCIGSCEPTSPSMRESAALMNCCTMHASTPSHTFTALPLPPPAPPAPPVLGAAGAAAGVLVEVLPVLVEVLPVPPGVGAPVAINTSDTTRMAGPPRNGSGPSLHCPSPAAPAHCSSRSITPLMRRWCTPSRLQEGGQWVGSVYAHYTCTALYMHCTCTDHALTMH